MVEQAGPDGADEAPGWHAETVAIRAGREHNGTDLAPAIHPTTTFVTPTVAEGRRMASSAGALRFYSRYGNPSVAQFEQAIAFDFRHGGVDDPPRLARVPRRTSPVGG